MKATRDEIEKSGAFMKDFWAFIKKYYTPEDDDAWWNAMFDEANDIAGRNDCPFAMKLLCSFMRFQQEALTETLEKQEGKTA